jgi:hypothetical protein
MHDKQIPTAFPKDIASRKSAMRATITWNHRLYAWVERASICAVMGG